jgi:hypothetical protein
MHFAVTANAMNCVKKLIETMPNMVNVQMMNGVTPVYLGFSS